MMTMASWFGGTSSIGNTVDSRSYGNNAGTGSFSGPDVGSTLRFYQQARLTQQQQQQQRKRKSIQELLQVLYPNRNGTTIVNRSSSGGTTGGGTSKFLNPWGNTTAPTFVGGSSSGTTTISSTTTRFSQLLLEYGEKPIQDWAVVAYSTPIQSSSSSSSLSSHSSASRQANSMKRSQQPISSSSYSTPNGKQQQDPSRAQQQQQQQSSTTTVKRTNKKKPITWLQSPEYNAKNKLNTTTLSSEGRSQSLTTSSKQHQQQRNLRSSSMGGSFEIIDTNDYYQQYHPSTIQMKNIHGRLYLCTGSIVFEPNDVSRGIIRCPFSKMDTIPSLSTSNINNNTTTKGTSSNTDNNDIQFVCRRHSVMKEDNVIGPYRQVSVPCQFRFEFLHSSSKQFLEISQALVNAAASNPHGFRSSLKYHSTPRSLLLPDSSNSKVPLQYYFDINNFVDVREQIQTNSSIVCSIVTPLQNQSGLLVITNERIYFQKQQSYYLPCGIQQYSGGAVQRWNLYAVIAIARRYHGLRDSAIEIYFQDNLIDNYIASSRNTTSSYSSVLFAFERRHDRELIIRCLQQSYSGTLTSVGGGLRHSGSSNSAFSSNNNNSNTHQLPCFTDRDFVIQVVQEWKNGTISNFDYLMALNSAAGRTFHDLSRYPVFPWVIQDYSSSKLDLTNEATFRDLSKPIGALNDERLDYFKKRLRSMSEMVDDNDMFGNNNGGGMTPSSPSAGPTAFLYGTHYSAPGYVLYFLVRSMPEHMLCLQNGKFDAPDRLFYSIPMCYRSVLLNHADVKELIPEFYNPSNDYDFLINTRGLQLGATQNGDRVNDVKLPAWAKSPRDFINQNNAALESDICTRNLPKWIDLIFGYKSRGEAALEADNLFHQYAYLGPNDLASMQSETERNTAELQATEFGIVPDQLFVQPHPQRHTVTSDTDWNIDFLISPDIGRASSFKDDPNREAWELLDVHMDDDYMNDTTANSNSNVKPNHHQDQSNMQSNYNNQHDAIIHHSHSIESQASFPEIEGSNTMNTTTTINMAPQQDQTLITRSPTSSSWDMQIIERKRIHNDAVSGCILLFDDDDSKLSILATTSLDGGLKIQSISLGGPSNDSLDKQGGGGFSSTLSRFSYNTIMSRGQVGVAPNAATQSKLSDYRTHSARDPLACLALATDGNGGAVAFAGGHDDVVLAYGIKSACAVASVYSHRDAVTGLDLLQRTPFDSDNSLWLEKSTHIMVSGSWDATVKVWSTSVSGGETVAINREPLAELFDADSSIVCVSAISCLSTHNDNESKTGGIVIAAGCADGSFCVWNVHTDGVQVLLHKEPTKRGSGPCSVVKWVCESNKLHLFAGFSTGKIATYKIVDGTIKRESAVSVGSPVLSLAYSKGMLLVGCADGGLRLLTILTNGGAVVIDTATRPVLWSAVNNNATSPGVSSLSITYKEDVETLTSTNMSITTRRCICSSGAEDGSIVLFELKQV